MDTGKKLLLISFSSVPAIDRHTAFVTGAARGLSRLFEAVDVITVKGDYLAHIERYHGSRLLRVPLVGEGVTDRAESFRRAVRRQIESDSYDVVHVRSPLEGVPVLEARDEKEYRVVYEAATFAVLDALGGGLHDDDVAALTAQTIAEEVHCASGADLVIVHSDAARLALRARGVATPIEAIPGGVNIDAFDWEKTTGPAVPTLLVVGAVAPWRDPTGMLEALRRALDVTPVALRWIGEPEAARRAAFAAYAAELGVDHAVNFEPLPDHDSLPLLISSATICLAPAAPVERFSVWGDQPPGLLEFLACRKPVVAARTPGVEEVVRDGTDALLYAAGDVEGLTAAIVFLLRNPKHRDLLANRAYRRVREQFSESAQRRALSEAYRELLGVREPFDVTASPVGDDSDRPDLAGQNGAREPITAVMEAASQSQRVKVDGDTRRVQGAADDEERRDTQPHIAVKEPAAATTDPESDPWVIPETTPHAKIAPEIRPSPLPALPRPATVQVEDTSRLAPPPPARDPADDE